MAGDDYPPAAFYFKVVFNSKADIDDTSFQDVSGIKATIETETYAELGENGSVYHLPKPPTYSNLVLKRGIADKDSGLVKWCRSIFEGDFASPIEPLLVQVHLMGENGDAIRSWSFDNAFPISWDVGNFNSSKNEVAIETIELRYSSFSREL